MDATTFQVVWERKLRFAAVFFVIFTTLYLILYVIDFLPEPPAPVAGEDESAYVSAGTESLPTLPSAQQGLVAVVDTPVTAMEEPASPVIAVLPDSIRFPSLNKTVPVLNPTSRTVADLDEALLQGAVRHPDSATLNQEGNVFILGHSSYLPSVRNKNFQAFNGVQDLQWGDTIEVTSGTQTYVYRVEKVYKAKASEVRVPIADTGSMLTIATCNSFGSTDDRYMVEATLQQVL